MSGPPAGTDGTGGPSAGRSVGDGQLRAPHASPPRPAPGGFAPDVRLVARQLRYEQLAFWRNPFGAIFTVGFSVIFLVLVAGSGGSSTRLTALGNIPAIQYYVPGFAAYGVMSACFNMLGVQLVVRRETGLLKRLRLSPLPTWALLGGIFLSSFLVAAIQIALLLGIGRAAYGLHLPHEGLALAVALAVGVLSFTALGVAVSVVIPNQEAAGPVIGIAYFVLLFLSGLWFPLRPGSALAQISAYFPVRHLILAAFAPFDPRRGASPWAWHDIAVMAAWGLGATVVAVRRFRWEPSRR